MVENVLGSVSDLSENLYTTNESGKLACVLCDILASSLESLIQHLESDHSFDPAVIGFFLLKVGVNPLLRAARHSSLQSNAPNNFFKCHSCSATFITYKGMKQHIGKAHTKLRKQVQCSQCDCKFKHKHALTFHMKQVHEKSTRVECPLCQKTLYNKYYLKKHLETCRDSIKDLGN